MRGIELLRTLQKLNKPFYAISDLERITRLSRSSLYVALNRWVGRGILEKVTQGIYVPTRTNVSLEAIASQLYIPNYLSFESALNKHGILNLIPYTVAFATTRKTRKYTLQRRAVEFRQIAPDLFFGFEIRNGYYVALPEKAFLDQIYFMIRGKATLDSDELNIKRLSYPTLKDLSRRFPSYVQNYIDKMSV
jgi:predicted transcriptional regulator of viral defense system